MNKKKTTEVLMFEKQVKAGATFLDNLSPGWENKIDCKDLNMDFYDSCVLGRVMGRDYSDKFVSLQNEAAIALGFDVPEDAYDKNENVYAVLCEVWVKEIFKRRAVRKVGKMFARGKVSAARRRR
jgi:hypothetical protein